MAVDKVVDSVKLDACLNAEADAIRAKTGGSADIPFDYANNKGFADAIAAISGGGGVRKAEGTFSLVNDSAPPVFTHNLGTQKIAMFVIPTGTVVAHSGYKNFYLSFVNTVAFLDDNYQFSVDVSNYNANIPDPITSGVIAGGSTNINGLPRVASGNASPWTTQGGSLTAGAVYGVGIGGFTLTDNTVKIRSNFASGSYRYMVFALE